MAIRSAVEYRAFRRMVMTPSTPFRDRMHYERKQSRSKQRGHRQINPRVKPWFSSGKPRAPNYLPGVQGRAGGGPAHLGENERKAVSHPEGGFHPPEDLPGSDRGPDEC